MSAQNEYRIGIDETPLSNKEYERLKNGTSLYPRVIAPRRKSEDVYSDDISRVAV